MVEIQCDKWTLNELEWDTNFFGVKSGKLVLKGPIQSNEINHLKEAIKEFEFVTITNLNSDPVNAQLIGKETKAFLADTNIQFVKKVNKNNSIEKVDNISIHKKMMKNEQVLDLVSFPFSKFTEDPEFKKRGGTQVYKQWVENSFSKENKSFVLSKDPQNDINGFLLFSHSGNTCIIELIAVSQTTVKSGIGSKMFYTLENYLTENGINIINVGTQLRNIGAINFYHKLGCKMLGCHQVFHLWNTN